MDRHQPSHPAYLTDRNQKVLAMREAGASWQEIERAFTLTRQQARYAYQLAKRAERRAAPRKPD